MGLRSPEYSRDGGPHSLLIGPIEVIDGTPILDIKPVVEEAKDFRINF